ncbi:MAG: type II toxin-antitoxin system VapC family toxin [Beijerinckiaceae bacterium]
MTFVIDGSVAIAAVSPDEDHRPWGALLDRALRYGAFASALWLYETTNIIGQKMKRGGIAYDVALELIDILTSGDIEIVSPPGPSGLAAILDLMNSRALSSYDAAYVMLARERRLPLATLDKRLALAAQMEGVEII